MRINELITERAQGTQTRVSRITAPYTGGGYRTGPSAVGREAQRRQREFDQLTQAGDQFNFIRKLQLNNHRVRIPGYRIEKVNDRRVIVSDRSQQWYRARVEDLVYLGRHQTATGGKFYYDFKLGELTAIERDSAPTPRKSHERSVDPFQGSTGHLSNIW